jgi:hypothetical protein
MFHQALCVTDDVPAVERALAEIVGAGLLDALLGPGVTAEVEVTALPHELKGRLTPGTTAISFAVDDLGARVAACRQAGLAVTVVAGDLPFAVVTVAGLDFELVEFA